MTTEPGAFATAWHGWLNYHRNNGFAVEQFLNPPAGDANLAAVEEAIGFPLPPDLAAMWRHANGQRDVFDIDDPSPGTILSPLFGGNSFLSTAGAMDDLNVRTPSGHEAGANDQWMPGGFLPSGADEAVIDAGRALPDHYSISRIN